jgi:methylmalonyl-CoA/ethylmalonyl-CoA epimerase
MKLHHLGIACMNIHEEIDQISKIHEIKKRSPMIFDPEQDANLVLLTLEDGTNLELISGPRVGSLVKKGISFYHLCFEVEDIEREIERLLSQGALLISPAKPALLFDDRKVAFLKVSYGIIELLEKTKSKYGL